MICLKLPRGSNLDFRSAGAMSNIQSFKNNQKQKNPRDESAISLKTCNVEKEKSKFHKTSTSKFNNI